MNILAIGAHHDDVERGAGGTLAKLVENGNQVFTLTLTNSETHYDIKGIHRLAKTAVDEAKEAAKILGLSMVVPPVELIQNVGELSYNTSYMRWIEELLTDKAIDTVFSIGFLSNIFRFLSKITGFSLFSYFCKLLNYLEWHDFVGRMKIHIFQK